MYTDPHITPHEMGSLFLKPSRQSVLTHTHSSAWSDRPTRGAGPSTSTVGGSGAKADIGDAAGTLVPGSQPAPALLPPPGPPCLRAGVQPEGCPGANGET